MKVNPFQRTPSKKINATMNVVPYIDVMLVLLVIFMVTAPMLTTGVDIDLPKEATQTLSTGKQLPVIVSLKANGELFVSYQDHSDVKVHLQRLIEILQELQNLPEYQLDGKPNVNVMINADQHNEYGAIMKLMANLQQAGIQKIGLLTESPTQHRKKNKS